MSLRVLQCINSAAFPLRREVRSIGEALVLLGGGPIRKWGSIWCLSRLSNCATSELTTDGGWEDAVASAAMIGAPEPHLQHADSAALIWSHELTAAGFAWRKYPDS